jgi:hypothetical protein
MKKNKKNKDKNNNINNQINKLNNKDKKNSKIKKINKIKNKNTLKKSKKFKIFFYIIILLLVIIITIISLLKIQFIIGEQLIINSVPIDKTIYLNQGETKEIEINITMKNFLLCKSYCTEKIYDISSGKKEEESYYKKDSKKSFSKKINITAPNKGTGIIKKRYELVCINEKTLFCPATEDKSSTTTFISTHYGPNETNFQLSNELKENLEIAIKLLNTSYNIINKEKDFIKSKDSLFFPIIYNKSKNNILKYENYKLNIEEIIIYLNNEEYENIKENIINSFEIILNINELISLQKEAVYLWEENILKHNSFARITKEIDLEKYKEMYSFYFILFDYNPKTFGEELSSIHSYLKNIKEIKNNILTYKSEKDINISKIIEDKKNIELMFEKNKNEIIINAEQIYLKYYPYTINIFNNTPLIILEKNQTENNFSKKNIIKDFEHGCFLIEKIIENLENHNINSSILKNNIINNTLIIDNITYENAFEKIEEFNEKYYNLSIQWNLNQSINDNNTIEKYELLFPYIDIEIKDDIYKIKKIICKAKNLSLNNYPPIFYENFTIEDILIFPTEYEELNLKKINPLIKMCCINSICNPCLNKEDNIKNYPILFLHGHSFNKEDTPEFSMNSLNDIMNYLEKEGFIYTGQLDLTQKIQVKSDWAEFNRPILTKATYYYITYVDVGINILQVHKSEKIENYALRLNEIIDILIKKTNQEKIIIVSHSMGGLVAREYITLFGENKVDKIIMIGTPNNGISGKIEKNCDITGAKKECEDLSENSLFLRRLNSRPQPENTKFYTISGVGCTMDNNEIGDGIVTLNSSLLPYAKSYIINGTCRDFFKTSLHGDLLKPDIYLETIEILKKILLNNK